MLNVVGFNRDGITTWGKNLECNIIEVIENCLNGDINNISAIKNNTHFVVHSMSGFLAICSLERDQSKSVVSISRHGEAPCDSDLAHH